MGRRHRSSPQSLDAIGMVPLVGSVRSCSYYCRHQKCPVQIHLNPGNLRRRQGRRRGRRRQRRRVGGGAEGGSTVAAAKAAAAAAAALVASRAAAAAAAVWGYWTQCTGWIKQYRPPRFCGLLVMLDNFDEIRVARGVGRGGSASKATRARR